MMRLIQSLKKSDVELKVIASVTSSELKSREEDGMKDFPIDPLEGETSLVLDEKEVQMIKSRKSTKKSDNPSNQD